MKDKIFIPDWKLERYVLGELPSDDLDTLKTLYATDGEFRMRVEALLADNAEILDLHPAEQMAKRINNLVAAERAAASDKKQGVSSYGRGAKGLSPLNLVRWGIPVIACAALLLVLPMGVITHDGLPEIEENRVKGTPPVAVSASEATIEVWRKEGDEAKRLPPEASARKGDIIQLRYVVPEQCYGALVSVDGRGVVTVHLPEDQTKVKAAALTPGNPIALKQSYELDDAPYYEVFYLITAQEEFNIDDVKRSLQDAKHPVKNVALPTVKDVTAFMLRKSQEVGMN